jgi:hypothetical protein
MPNEPSIATDTLQRSLTVDAGQKCADDCEHAALLGIVQRALEASPEFAAASPGAKISISVPLSMSLNSDTYRSGFEVPVAADV